MTSTVPRTGAPTSTSGDGSASGAGWTPPELLAPLLVLILGVALLLPGHGLWFDELFTAEVARLPLGDIVSAIVRGEGTTSYLAGVPPSYNAPYYLVAHAWMTLPGLGGDTALRVLSLLATAGGLALITRAVARLAGRAANVSQGLRKLETLTSPVSPNPTRFDNPYFGEGRACACARPVRPRPDRGTPEPCPSTNVAETR